MTTLLSYLRQGFEVLEQITKDEFDNLQDKVRLHRINPEKSTPEHVQELVGLTSHYYGLCGTKLSQITGIRLSLERQVERLKIQLAQRNGVALSKRAELDRLAIADEQCFVLLTQLDEAKAIQMYFENMRETLYMCHYSLRKETDLVGSMNGSSGSRNRVNYGGQ